MENVVIVGSGPAGLTAAIYCARANLQPLLIEGPQPGGQLTETTDVENYPGFELPVSGFDLVMNMRKQAERMGTRLMADHVTACDFSGEVKRLTLESAGELQARTVILATGASARYLGLPTEHALIGKGVSGCATCDGAFYRDQDVAVVGGGDTAMEDALYLARIAKTVTLVHRRHEFRASKVMVDRVLATSNIKVVWESTVAEVCDPAKNAVTAIRVKHVKTGVLSEIPVTGLFIAIGHTPNTQPFRAAVACDDVGYIVAKNCRTSVDGVFAAGDVQDAIYRQAVTAAGTGCMAALEVERHLAAKG